MKAAIYIRVSSQEQNLHGYSLEAQETMLRNYAAENSFEVHDLYADRGKSANKALHKRTELLRMVKDAEAGMFQIILFKDITRWSRNSAQYYIIQERLDRCGVSWLAVEQPYLETRTPTGRFQVTVMLGTAQLESENTSQRIRFVQNHRAAQGGVLSGKVPIGYKIESINGMKRLVIDPEKRDIVNDMFRYYAQCRNQTETIRYINDRYGIFIWNTRFSSMLRNPIYKGQYRDNENYCEPYLTESEWSRLQTDRPLRRIGAHNGEFLFRGLIRCPKCGHMMTGAYNNNTVYYRCTYAMVYKKCDYTRYPRQDRIEQQLLDQVAQFLDYTEVYCVPGTTDKPTEDVELQKKRIESKLNRLKELYIDGDIDKASYNSRKNALQTDLGRLRTAHNKTPMNIENLLKTPWRTLYEEKNSAEKAEWWRFITDRIDIDGEDYVIRYRSY